MKIRALFISDTHFGCKHTNFQELGQLIKSIKTPPEYLYLVGDIVDGWRLRRNWHWKDEYNQILKKFLTWSKKGTKIIWITGNHDEFLRDFAENFGSIEVANEWHHTTKNGRQILVIHGDRFDCLMKCGNLLKFFGSFGYEKLILVNRMLNGLLRFFGVRTSWSLSKYIKSSIKQVSIHVANFETLLTEYAKEKECSGVVCGHIHIPKSSKVNGVDYFNCGDWQENTTYIIEDNKGNIKLHEYQSKETHPNSNST